ncbi:MAG: hypothetical protein IID37_12765 [Planctomycetes bacterium]|nr:hypothetical protein [Planctomycetota bacterium]
MPEDAQQLDRLLSRLAEALNRRERHGDAIDRILDSQPRRTEVRSLTNDASIKAFRRELIDGFIRADTANRLLGLIEEVVARL